MKKSTKGIAIGAAAVCLLAGMAGSPKKAESLELSIPLYSDEYDINTDIPVEISVSPDDADIDNLEYFSDSSTVTFSDAVINTGSAEGDYSFYVRSGDVGSNTLSIHVVDIAAQNEAAQKAEEERLAKEAEQKAAEEQAAKEAEQKAAEEQAAKEAEQKAAEEQAAKEAAQKAAEEQAAREAEQKAAEEQAAKEVAAQQESEPAPAPQASAEPASVVESQTQTIPNSTTAYLSATGSKYHSIDHCGNMNPNKARKTTVAEAEASGFGRCSKCW